MLTFGPGCCCSPSRYWRVYVPRCGLGVNGTNVLFNASPTSGIGGILCEVFSDSARTVLLGSGTTDAVGRVDVAVPDGGGTRYIRLSHPTNARFGVRQTGEVWGASGNISAGYGMPAGADYTCSTICDYPLSRTLYATVTLFGAVTLVTPPGVDAVWRGEVVVDYPGYSTDGVVQCFPSPMVVSIQFSNSQLSVATMRRKYQPPDSITEIGCPTDTTVFGHFESWGLPSSVTSVATGKVCPPGAFMVSGSQTHPGPIAFDDKIIPVLYGNPPWSASTTITE